MKALFNGKEIDIELSDKSKKELKELEEELDIPEFMKNVKC